MKNLSDSEDINRASEKSKYMLMPRDQNTVVSHKLKIDNISFESVEDFKYVGTILTNQNSMSVQEEIKNRFKSRNACYHSMQNLLSSSLLFKNLKIKMYTIIILPLLFMGEKLGRSY